MQAKTKGRPPRELKNVDADWIQDRIKSQHRSQRELAAAWGGVSAAAVTRVLHNNRRLTLDEFATLCEFLDVPPATLLPRLGYSVRTSSHTVAITGIVTDNAQVSFVSPEVGRRVALPMPLPGAEKHRCLIVRAKNDRLTSWNGSLVLYTENRNGDPPAFDRNAIIEVAGEVVPIWGVLRRGSKAKTMMLRRFGEATEEEVEHVINAHPVRQIICEELS